MKAPTGKLAFAYRTIAELEAERDQLRAEVERLQLLVSAGEEVEQHLQRNSDIDRIRADALRKDTERYQVRLETIRALFPNAPSDAELDIAIYAALSSKGGE